MSYRRILGRVRDLEYVLFFIRRGDEEILIALARQRLQFADETKTLVKNLQRCVVADLRRRRR